MKVPALLKNKYVCYALMALATLNVIGYVTVRAWECLALFALAGYSCYCYCKNKSCSILAALFIANFVFGCGRVKEGFEDAFKGPAEHMSDAVVSLEGAANSCADHATQNACKNIMDAAGTVKEACIWNEEKQAIAASAAGVTPVVQGQDAVERGCATKELTGAPTGAPTGASTGTV